MSIKVQLLVPPTGDLVPLVPYSPPLAGLGSSERGGAAHLASETRLLPLHLDLWSQHEGRVCLFVHLVFFIVAKH